MSDQPSGLGTPEACENISPGYAFFAYPGYECRNKTRTPEVVRGVAAEHISTYENHLSSVAAVIAANAQIVPPHAMSTTT